MRFITTLLALLLAISAHANDDCRNDLGGNIIPFRSRGSAALKIEPQYSAHSLKTFENLAARSLGYFSLYTNSRKVLLLARVEAALAHIQEYLVHARPGDELVPQMKSTLERWQETHLLEKIRASVDIRRLRPDGRPFDLLPPEVNEEIGSVRTMVMGVQHLRAYRILSSPDSSLAKRESALKSLILQVGLAINSLKMLRDDLNLKDDDLESVERVLDFIKADLSENMFFKLVIQMALKSPDARQRELGQALKNQQSRLEVMSWYIRNRGLH